MGRPRRRKRCRAPAQSPRGRARARPLDAARLRPHLRRRLPRRSALCGDRPARPSRPGPALVPDRPRGRLAHPRRAPAQAPRGRGRPVPRRQGRHARGPGAVMWVQREITLREHPRGFHLITRAVLEAMPEVGQLRAGLLHVFIRHTSASLTLNENASPDVREDFEAHFNAAVPEDAPYWTHTIEGPDDMPAHIKASVLGPSLSLPVRDGRLALGTWQGSSLCENRERGGPRSVLVTLMGQP